jgi:hypothetical protein
VLEWFIAAICLSVAAMVGSMIVRELGAQPAPATASPGREIAATAPPSVPARAVSVPVLPLVDGKELRIGDTVQAVAGRLGRSAESGRQELDRGSLGERLTRFYDYRGARFILVFEPFERNGEARLAAIYLPEGTRGVR